jgi:hypothetical protein
MPLPTGGAWPPENLRPVYQRLAAWSAWYSGNPDELSWVYGGQAGVPYDSTSLERIQNHPSQYRGGVVGWFARWFWGEPLTASQKRTKLHIPVAADISQTSAELLFSEPPKITVPEGGSGATAAQDRIEQLVDDGVHATFLEAAEICAALSGVYLATCWDREVADRPWLAARHPDAAVPEWRYDRLAEVTFWRVLEDDGKRVVRHLERHEPGYILHGVYEGTPEQLGKQVDLGAFPATENLEPVVETGLPNRLTATYIPNMRPNRIWRNLPAAAYCGRSDFTGLEPLMDALDETWSSWMRDIRQGVGRILVPEQYLENLGAGRGSRWDPSREVYEALSMLPSNDRSQIEQIQFAIRVAEHRDTTQEQVEHIIRGAGYSAQTFGLKGDVAVTATEVNAREKKTITTRNRKIVYWRPGTAEAVETLLMVDAAQFNSGIDPVRPDVDFGPYVGTDIGENAQTAQLMRAAEAASTETLVKMLHPDWDDKQVAEEVARIRDDSVASLPPMLSGPADQGGAAGIDEKMPPDEADTAEPDAADEGY